MSSCVPPRHPRTSITSRSAFSTSGRACASSSAKPSPAALRRVSTPTSPTTAYCSPASCAAAWAPPAAPTSCVSASRASAAAPSPSGSPAPSPPARPSRVAFAVEPSGLAQSESPAVWSILTVRSWPSAPTTRRSRAKASTTDQSSRSGSAGSTVVHRVRSTSGRSSARVLPLTPTMRSPTCTGASGAAHVTYSSSPRRCVPKFWLTCQAAPGPTTSCRPGSWNQVM